MPQTNPLAGAIYHHYKGGDYEIVGVATHSETQAKMVVYTSLYESRTFPMGTLFVRPLDVFFENVSINGTMVPRFTRSTEHDKQNKQNDTSL